MYSNSNVVVTGGSATYVAGDSVVHNHGSRPGFKRLQKHVVPSALHNSGEVSDQPKCHPGTRVAILEHLEAWAAALIYSYPIKWLHGPAGSGKSSILRTIAQILFDQGLLLASFFFFRSASDRNNSNHFIATIAYQLALYMPPTRPFIEEAVDRNPLIFSLSLWDQAQALIVSPILAACSTPNFDPLQFPRIIIIDGLDECSNPDNQYNILQVISRIVQNIPIPIAVLVASRPEHHIRDAFDHSDLNKSSSRLILDDSYNPDADIKKYLDENFSTIKQVHRHLTSSWPSPNVVTKLVAKASGQFIYVSTVVKFISSPRHNPIKRLDIILGMIDAGNLKPFEQLDMLYSTIFFNIDENDRDDVLRILGVLLVPYEDRDGINRTPVFLEFLLSLDTGEVKRLLFDLESLLTITADNKPVHFFHASLGDYLFDRSRSGQFWIDAGNVYADLAQHCINRLLDSKDWQLLHIKSFFFSNSFLLFSKASPVAGLRKAIESCDLTNMVDFSHWILDFSQFYISDVTPTFLQAIRNSTFLDANGLYLEKRASYARLIRPRIQIYLQHISLKRFLIAAISTEASGQDIEFYKSLRHIFQISRDDWDIERQQGLDLGYSSLELIQVTRELLNDNSASNVGYFVDENQYADVAFYLLQFMTGALQISSWPDRIEECMSRIIPPLLSKASIREDMLDHIKRTLWTQAYSENDTIKRALAAYISRSGDDVVGLNDRD